MAETQTESSVAGDSSRDRGRGVRTAPLPPVPAKSVPIAQRKRQRLDRVLDKIASQVAVFSGHGKPFESATDVFQLATQASHHLRKKLPLSITADGALPALVRFQAVLPALDPRLLAAQAESMEESTLTVTASLATTGGGGGGTGGVIMSTSANNNNTVAEATSDSRDRFITPRAQSKVFRFDSIDQERYYYGAISEEEENAAGDDLSEEDVFSPHSISSERSPLSPSGTADSPCISFSPLRLKDSAEDEDTLRTDTSTPQGQSTVCLTPRSNNSAPGYHCKKCFPTTFQDPMESSDCHRHTHTSSPGLPPSPLSPATPNTPLLASQGFSTGMTFPAASPLHSLEFLLQARYMEDLSRRRAHSDSDLQSWYDSTLLTQHQQHHTATRGRLATPIVKTKPAPLLACNKGGSLESDPSSPGTQDSPLDLSLRRSTSSTSSESPGLSILGPYSWLSPTTINSFLPSPSASTPSRSPVLRVPPSPGVSSLSSAGTPKSSVSTREETDSPPAASRLPAIVAAGAETEGALTTASGVTPTGPLVGMEVACVCPVCGQMFALHDRLAKHMASRHKSKSRSSLEAAVTRAYLCDICHRPFARSDMLTRHMRLHTGLKPYTCRVCGQVFSRSDHLSTHQRTHTGEKPYRCPQCPYAACRRDMITRHLRTHTRGESGSGGGSTPSVNYLNTDTGPLEAMEDPTGLASTTVQLALPPTGRSRGRRTRNRASEMLARSLSAEDVPFQDHSDISFQTPSPR